MKIKQILETKKINETRIKLWGAASVRIFLEARRHLRKQLEQGGELVALTDDELNEVFDIGIYANGDPTALRYITSHHKYAGKGNGSEPLALNLWDVITELFQSQYTYSLDFEENVTKILPRLIKETHKWVDTFIKYQDK